MTKHQYPIIDVITTLHSSHVGSTDAVDPKELLECLGWLRWRITEGWDHNHSQFDYSVRALALAVLEEYKCFTP